MQQLFQRVISAQFIYEIDLVRSPIIEFVLAQIGAGLVFLCLLIVIPSLKTTRTALIIIFTVGLVLRLILFGSTPIMEDDFYRYLWDGAVLAHGYNPYLLAPNHSAITIQTELSQLALYAGVIFDRINHPGLSTIYPPLSQLFFAVAYWIDAWNLDSWRLVLLSFELTSFYLLIKILSELYKSTLWIALYWWNPLVIKETFNSTHMDALLLPFLLLAILCIIRKRPGFASVGLTLAAGIKLWPLLLLPFSLRPLLSDWRRSGQVLLAIILLGSIVLGPLVWYGLGEHSGLSSYAQSWQRNSVLFPLIQAAFSLFPGEANAGLISRVFIAMCLVSLVLMFNREKHQDPTETIKRITWTIAVLFFLSPAIYPWYLIWFAPLLCFYPNRSLLLLTALMPIYYLRFYFAARNNTDLFDTYIVWIQYLPVALLLIFDYHKVKIFPSIQKTGTK